jgi:hypothetical protein
MPLPFRPLLLGATTAAAALAFATPPASATPVCAGTAGTAVFCVTPNPAGVPTVDPFGSSIGDCVYLGAPPCKPVSVPVPTVTPGTGPLVYLSCGGPLIDPIATCG